MAKSICVVCVGNICRSPMAEAMLREEIAARSIPMAIESAGLGALVGHAADPIAQELMHERGLDIGNHIARQLDNLILAKSDLILVMESGHKRAILELESTTRGKIFRLCEYSDTEIEDPYRCSRDVFEKCLAQIEKGVSEWAEKLKGF